MNTKRVAIVQSNYIPWKGYFDLINSVDEFILYDDVQYTRRDWRNRNLIKTPKGLQWLSIPVAAKGNYTEVIKNIRVSERHWAEKHWRTLQHTYAKAAAFDAYRAYFDALYLSPQDERLSAINFKFIRSICDLLEIRTTLSWSMDYEISETDKNLRLLALCKAANAGHYLSGPAAQGYLAVEQFQQAGISVSFMDYSGYPEYRQLHAPFEHGVTILDLIFNEGRNAARFMKSFAVDLAKKPTSPGNP